MVHLWLYHSQYTNQFYTNPQPVPKIAGYTRENLWLYYWDLPNAPRRLRSSIMAATEDSLDLAPPLKRSWDDQSSQTADSKLSVNQSYQVESLERTKRTKHSPRTSGNERISPDMASLNGNTLISSLHNKSSESPHDHAGHAHGHGHDIPVCSNSHPEAEPLPRMHNDNEVPSTPGIVV